MPGGLRTFAPMLGALVMLFAGPVAAQKSGGILKLFHRDSPASVSIHEEATISAVAPFIGGVQQSDPVQPARKAEPAGIHRAGTGRELVVERRLHPAHASSCARASNGMTASRSPRPTSNAPGTC